MSARNKKSPLPHLMVAPNGARRDKTSHPAIPLSDDALVQTAIECQRAGADGIHIHIRDGKGRHLLDANRYTVLLTRLSEAVPDMYLQVTSEAANRYGPEAQQQMVKMLKPRHVSVAMREMIRAESDWSAATAFYSWAEDAGVDIQHILYSSDELKAFIQNCITGRIAGNHHLVQLVLGTYDGSEISRPSKVSVFTDLIKTSGLSLDWGVCAFGPEETSCLIEAVRQGGKARVGFENSLWNADGTLAKSNAARVLEVRSGIDDLAGA